MLDRNQLEAFAAVVEEQSFERAAAILNITRGAVSQRIKALEESLSTVLLVRDRPIVATARGEVILRHVKALRLLEDSSLSELALESTRAPAQLAIAVNADSLATWFPRVIWRLLSAKRVALEIVVDDQDHTAARLARGEVLGCVSTEPSPPSGFVAEPLGTMEYRCYAARPFAEQYFAQGLNVHAALRAPAVLFNRKDALHDEFLGSLFGLKLDRYIKHYFPSPQTLLDGVTAGVGYGLVPSAQVAARGEPPLVDLAPDHPVNVSLYWHHWAAGPSLSEAIAQLVLEEARLALQRSASLRARGGAA